MRIFLPQSVPPCDLHEKLLELMALREKVANLEKAMAQVKRGAPPTCKLQFRPRNRGASPKAETSGLAIRRLRD